MTQDLLEIPAFLRRTEPTKGATVTEPKKKREPKKAILRLVIEYEHRGDIVAVAAELVAKAKEGNGTIRSAKLSGLPTSAELT